METSSSSLASLLDDGSSAIENEAFQLLSDGDQVTAGGAASQPTGALADVRSVAPTSYIESNEFGAFAHHAPPSRARWRSRLSPYVAPSLPDPDSLGQKLLSARPSSWTLRSRLPDADFARTEELHPDVAAGDVDGGEEAQTSSSLEAANSGAEEASVGEAPPRSDARVDSISRESRSKLTADAYIKAHPDGAKCMQAAEDLEEQVCLWDECPSDTRQDLARRMSEQMATITGKHAGVKELADIIYDGMHAGSGGFGCADVCYLALMHKDDLPDEHVLT